MFSSDWPTYLFSTWEVRQHTHGAFEAPHRYNVAGASPTAPIPGCCLRGCCESIHAGTAQDQGQGLTSGPFTTLGSLPLSILPI